MIASSSLITLHAPFNTVYGSLMHHTSELKALGNSAHQPPYHKPPQAPVLYIKPSNTFSVFGARIVLPQPTQTLQARACLGLIFEKNRSIALINKRLDAIDSVAIDDLSWGVFCDLSLPHASFHRPPVKFNAFDGSLGLPRAAMTISENNVNDLEIETWVNGQCVHRYSTADWLTTAEQQLQAVSEFIAFEAGDVLMLGCPPDAPLVRAGDVVQMRCLGQVFTELHITEGAP